MLQAQDFEYDGEFLSDKGYIICSLDNKNEDTIDSDSQLTFNTESFANGKRFDIASAIYKDRIEFSFLIMKIPYGKTQDELRISTYESREIKRWLNRPTFKKFKFIQPEWEDIFMMGSFNVSNVEIFGTVYLLELKFISNSSMAFKEDIVHKFTSSDSNNEYVFYDESDEIGYIYPNTLKITCLEDGDLEIHNSIENRTTIIKNCIKDEVITFNDDLYFFSSIPSHKIQNDFNYIFLRIANSYENNCNKLTFSKSVTIEFSYNPYIKAVM